MAEHSARFKWKAFGRDLRECRHAADLGLRELARELKIHHATWCRAENGKPLTVPIFLFLCDWLGVDPQIYAVRRATVTAGKETET